MLRGCRKYFCCLGLLFTITNEVSINLSDILVRTQGESEVTGSEVKSFIFMYCPKRLQESPMEIMCPRNRKKRNCGKQIYLSYWCNLFSTERVILLYFVSQKESKLLPSSSPLKSWNIYGNILIEGDLIFYWTIGFCIKNRIILELLSDLLNYYSLTFHKFKIGLNVFNF